MCKTGLESWAEVSFSTISSPVFVLLRLVRYPAFAPAESGFNYAYTSRDRA